MDFPISQKNIYFYGLPAEMREYKPYDEQVLLDLLANSDEAAFTEIYHRYWRKLFVVAYNRLKEVQVAEDAVHDVFASLWRNRQTTKIESLENYLAVGIKYTIFSQIKKREKERLFQKANPGASTAEATLEDSVHYKRLLSLVNEEIEKLPTRCRLVFKSSRQAGKSVKEIANEMNISAKTVENQINRAIRHLKLATRNPVILLAALFLGL